MMRCKFLLAGFLMCGMFVGFGMTRAQPGKEPKEPIKQPAEPDTMADDLKIINENGMKGTGPDLIDYFHSKTLKQPDPKEIAALVKKLGDDDFATREDAFTKLVAMGGSALAGIKDGETDPDLEIRKRSVDLKARLDAKAEPILQAAAARVVAKLKPAGAAEKLIAFVPFAGEQYVVDQVCKSLGAVAVRDGKVEPILVKSLSDPIAIRRAAAGEALIRANVKDEFASVKKLLKDGDVLVRYRVCMAMLTSQDKDIVPVLIDLLVDAPANQTWRVEEALFLLAGDKAPTIPPGSTDAARKAARDVWSKWYAANEKTVDMAKLSAGSLFLDYTLIVQHNNRIGGPNPGNVGEVFELDENKKVRWKITLPTGYPVDAQVVASGQRVVIAEYTANQITERDLKGEIKWDYKCGGNPFHVHRMPNGNTFVAMQGRLVEVDRDRNEVWSYTRVTNDIVRARILPGGEVAFITNQGEFIRMDARTKNIKKQFRVNPVAMLYGSMEVLPNGNIIVPHYNMSRVNEYTQEGAQVGNPITVAWANSVARLPNGNNLIASYQQRKVMEYNGNQSVWEYATDGPVFVARRR